VTIPVPGPNLVNLWDGLEFSPDGKTLAAFGGNGDTQIYLYGIEYAASP